MQEGSAQPCGCDAGAGHVCQWHLTKQVGKYYDDRKEKWTVTEQPKTVGCVQRGDYAPATETYPCDPIGYVRVDDHGAITPTVAMTTTATAAPKDHSPVVGDIPFPPAARTLSGYYYDVKPAPAIGKIEQLTTQPVLSGKPGSYNAFTVKDSGARQEFASGMVRDTADGKIDYTSVLEGPMLVRWAEHLTKAKQKYPDVAPGVANWTLATGDAELDRFRKSAFRHFLQWMRGDEDEDHAAAVFFNVNGAEYVKGRR